MHIDEHSVTEFKAQYCDENPIIGKLLSERFGDWVEDPILDVGCGLGDIAAAAFPHHRVVLLDRLPYPGAADSLSHHRLTVDFFDFKPLDHFNTALFSHVTQFLDENPKELNARLHALRPSKVITVMNSNDGFFGDLLKWVKIHMPEANPEIEISGFPEGYQLDREEEFTATLSCPNFQVLTQQVCYLLDTVASAEQFEKLQAFLTGRLAKPVIPIHERIRGYLLEQ
jgi:SAM-dependent methyltransferase